MSHKDELLQMVKQYSSETTDELKSSLTNCLSVTASELLRMSAIIRVLEDRGENLASLRIGLLPLLERIAYGQTMPEVAVKFMYSPKLLGIAMKLSIPEQKRCVEGKEFQVAEIRNGDTTHRLCKFEDMSNRDLGQVFESGTSRTVEKQIAYIRSRPEYSRGGGEPVKVDKKAGCIYVTGERFRITREDLASFLVRLG